MPRRTPTPWIVTHDGSGGDDAYAAACKRCGAVQRFAMPMALPVYIAAAKAFLKMHRNCKPRPDPPSGPKP